MVGKVFCYNKKEEVLEEAISETKIDIDPEEEPQTEPYFDDEEESDSDSDSEEDESGLDQHVTASYVKSYLYGSREIHNDCLQYIADLINRLRPVALNTGDKEVNFITCCHARTLKNIGLIGFIS
ncbi:hypothetical protein K501DRAFT_337224 [Backusella circina FSU 941]|nr:hypothetical protein K501DRAFT_337224 [Backusella circina FSU 941]